MQPSPQQTACSLAQQTACSLAHSRQHAAQPTNSPVHIQQSSPRSLSNVESMYITLLPAALSTAKPRHRLSSTYPNITTLPAHSPAKLGQEALLSQPTARSTTQMFAKRPRISYHSYFATKSVNKKSYCNQKLNNFSFQTTFHRCCRCWLS
jgi:hypothetical protein